MRLSSLAKLTLLTLALSVAPSRAQTPPKTKQVPPPGVAIPEEERKTLEAGVQELKAEIAKIPKSNRGTANDLLPDVEIYLKAVDWPLRYNEFFNEKEVGTAKNLLKEGLARAKALQGGKAPWTEATGPVVRGYRSRIDGSAQPYGIVVPASWKKGDARKKPLFVFNHGRGENLTELAFINGRTGKPGEFTPPDTFVIHPYGRFCNATKFAGETDVFEAIAHASSMYPIDAQRVAMTGFSMGGASVWHLATHHAWLWAAASPGAGFAETPIYSKAFAEGKEAPPWYEQTLWHLYNATDVVANLQNTHLVAYSGEIDPQKQSADLMEKAAADAGFKLERLIGPKTGHKYEPETKKELDRRLIEATAKGKLATPAKVELVTYTLQYNRQAWVIADALEEHWKRAEIKAEIANPKTINIKTSNVAAFTLRLQALPLPLAAGAPRVVIDGQNLNGPAVATGDQWVASFRKNGAQWSVAGVETRNPALRKESGLQGPIDHALMESFVYVRPTGKPLTPESGKWVQAEMERAIPQWRTVFRGEARVIDDKALTPELIADSNLVLWGDPQSNAVLGKIAAQLPVKWSGGNFQAGGQAYSTADHAPIFIYPNPLNPKRYVVVNSSFTFRQGSNTSNALQTPCLPDWAVVDLRTPPSTKWPGLIADAGFFDESWQWKKAAAK